MVDIFLKALFTLFIAIGPIENGAFFAGLTQSRSLQERRRVALKTTLIATGMIAVFPFLGNYTLHIIGLDLFALELAGGLLLFLLAIQMVMGDYGSESTCSKSLDNRDISFFPLAMPLVAGPAAMTQSTVLFAGAHGSIDQQKLVFSAIFAVMAFSYICFLLGDLLTRILRKNGIEMLTRILGIFLAAIAVDLVVQGIKHANFFSNDIRLS